MHSATYSIYWNPYKPFQKFGYSSSNISSCMGQPSLPKCICEPWPTINQWDSPYRSLVIMLWMIFLSSSLILSLLSWSFSPLSPLCLLSWMVTVSCPYSGYGTFFKEHWPVMGSAKEWGCSGISQDEIGLNSRPLYIWEKYLGSRNTDSPKWLCNVCTTCVQNIMRMKFLGSRRAL